jgi:sec1 family domain-containing protein 1
MLNLNQPLTKTLAAEPVWKLLIYDRVGQDIISPLLSVQELRDLGCTLHMYGKLINLLLK